jgi:hypothetical protein
VPLVRTLEEVADSRLDLHSVDHLCLLRIGQPEPVQDAGLTAAKRP